MATNSKNPRRSHVEAIYRALSSVFLVLLLCVVALPAHAAFNNTTPRANFAGKHNYVVTGGTLRSQPNNINACSLNASSTGAVAGIPAGSTIMKAFLYWGGSGATPDYTVTFAGTSVTATGQFTETYDTKSFFGGFYDVTSLVTGNGNYTFSNLAVNTNDPYCSGQNVLSAWALVVVYSNASEPYRYTRVYDGLQLFRGSTVTTTQSGFRVPDLLDGKVSVVTWEGDPDTASSFPLDGFTEELKFDGHELSNAGCDATDNVYNSTIGTPSTCSTTAYGVDIDTFNVTSFLYEGQSSAELKYSSGNDAVFLSTQVISTTNTPVADLDIKKTHNGSYFTAGQNGSYNIVVKNLGPEIATGTATVTDTLPTGLSFVSGAGTGWTCSAVGQVVTCNNSAPTIALGASLPALTLTVAVDGGAAATVDNTATVSHPMFDGTGGNNTSTDTVTVRRANLSTSTKSVLDVNGGSAEAGDVLRYTITLTETGGQIAATGVSVIDDLAANLGDLAIVSVPAGSTDNSVGTGGANDTGQVNVTGITVPASGSVTIVFEAIISGDVVPGDKVNNTAVITNPSGPTTSPVAPTLTIPDPAPPASGNKVLYVYDKQSVPNQSLLRTPQPAATAVGNHIVVAGGPNTKTWPLTAAVATGTSLVLPAQTVTIYMMTAAGNSKTGNNRSTTVTLLNGGTAIATSGAQNVSGTTVTRRTYTVTIPATTIAAGNGLNLRFNNNVGTVNREVWVYGRTGATSCLTSTTCSKVTFNSNTVINVDDVSIFSAVYPSTSTKTIWEAGDTIYIRADISDPFGGYDVSGARLTLRDGSNAIVVNNLAMTARTNPVYSSGTPNRFFEYQYTIPTSPNYGTFTATVTGTEGQEGTVTHSRATTFPVAPKALSVVKSHTGDFIAGANNSYSLVVSNSGGTTITGTTSVRDTLATGLSFVSGTGTGWSCSASGQNVTCNSTSSVTAGSSMATITLTVFVAGNMGSSVDNQATVGNSTIGAGAQKPGNTDTALIRHPDLSTSTKGVVDLNGGDANPGDTLRYTITVIESAGYAANNVTVTDTLPSSLTGLSGLNTGLSTCNGTPAVVGNTLTVTGLSLAGGASCKLVFDVQVSGSAGAGLTIDNTASVNNPNGPSGAPGAPTITVSQSQVAVPGNKILYVYANNTMTRVAQTGTGTNTVNENSYQDFVLAGVANPLTIAPSSSISIALWLQRSGNTTTTSRTVYAKLFKNGSTQIGAVSNSVTFSSTTLAQQAFTITAPSFGTAGNLQPGDTLVLRVYNDSGTGGTPRTVDFAQRSGTSNSTLSISTPTVVRVDTVNVYSAVYPSTAQVGAYGQGDTIYVRATVSDPFGFADISGGSIVIKNPGGTTVHTATLTNALHSKSTSGATRIYEYAYTIPAGPPVGAWTAKVTANEGSEGTITHTGSGGFNIGGGVTLRKTWGAGATAGDTVTLTITGGTSAVAGSSTAPSTLTPATSNAATGATITLAEAFTVGLAGNYTITLACEKDSDHTTVTPSGAGLSRTITMPAGSVTCTFTNGLTVPLTVVKVATVYSDPVNATTNPKAIPGALVTYVIIVTAPAETQADTDSIVISDPIPAQTSLFVNDLPDQPGNTPFGWLPNSSNLTFTFGGLGAADDVDFSNDDGATWTYTPVPDAQGVDSAVTNVRFNPKGTFAPGQNFWLGFRVQIN